MVKPERISFKTDWVQLSRIMKDHTHSVIKGVLVKNLKWSGEAGGAVSIKQ